jgi:hypothetical protein
VDKCRRLTTEEQAEWDKIQTMPDKVRQMSEAIFVRKIKKSWDTESVNNMPRSEIVEPKLEDIKTTVIMPDEEPLSPERFKEVMGEIAKETEEFFQAVPDLALFQRFGVPGLMKLEDELALRKTALASNPKVKNIIKENTDVNNSVKNAEIFLTNLHELELHKDPNESTEETIARDKVWKKLSKQTGIDSNTLRTMNWKDLSPKQQRSLGVSLIKDKSLLYKSSWWGKDARYVFSDWQEETGLPFGVVFERMKTAGDYIKRLQDKYLKRITENPEFKHLIHNTTAQERVAMELNSRNPDFKLESPEGLTQEELHMADAIAEIYDEWKPIVRYMRFMEAYEKSPLATDIHTLIPDAPIADLEEAKRIYETESEETFWAFMTEKTWGVVDSGYDPIMVSKPTMTSRKYSLESIRGTSRLMERVSEEAPVGQEKGLLRRFDTYNRSMATRMFLRKEMVSLKEMMENSWDKWDNPQEVEKHIVGYIRETQGFPQEGSIFDHIIRRLQKWAYANVFMHPFLGFRNILQPLWSFPFRKDLISSMWEYNKLPISFKHRATIRFSTVIDQSGRVMREFLFQGDESSQLGSIPKWLDKALTPMKLVGKGFDFLSSWSAKIPTMPFSDKVSRSWAYRTGLVKAYKATQQFKEDGNLEDWYKNSGVSFLSKEQQTYIVEMLLIPDGTVYNMGIPGLMSLTGSEAASIKIAEDLVDVSMYMYDRANSARIHYGTHGRSFASLLTFPRSTLQLYATQVGKVLDTALPTEERTTATRNIVLLFITGELLSMGILSLSGRRRKDYSLLNTVTWKFGGLSLALMTDVSITLVDTILAAFGNKEDKEAALAKLPSEFTRLGDTLLGFYKVTWDLIETATDEKAGLDTRYLRQVRAWVDSNYTPEQVDKAERTVIEKFQKVLAGAEQPDPTMLEKALDSIYTEQQKLGEIQANGSRFQVKDFASKVDSATKDVPENLLDKDFGFTDLTLFYLDCKDAWRDYELLSTIDPSVRRNWRLTHPEEEAMMLFWGKVSKSEYTKGSRDGQEIVSLMHSWTVQYSITEDMHPKWSGW